MKGTIKKIIPYLLLALIFMGVFGIAKKTEAQSAASLSSVTTLDEGECLDKDTVPTGDTKANCKPPNTWWAKGATSPSSPTDTSGLGNNLPSCSIVPTPNVAGCLVNLAYYIFSFIPSMLLLLSAMFFNALVALTLSNKMISGSGFLNDAWGVVRDISNIFFMLVLLYIAIRTILNIGGSETKKMIGQVIIMALLINFSMFFTKVVIDTANVIALVFYNKINTVTTQNGESKTYIPSTNAPIEKDLAGGMMNAFNPGQLLSQKFFEDAKTNSTVIPATKETLTSQASGFVGRAILRVSTMGVSDVVGWLSKEPQGIPNSLFLGMILISGAIMLFATYAFFLAGISFLGRLIELWLLIIFSPFAFMSSIIPKLGNLEYIGWESWLKRLMSTAFMAPIFMFFMYFIFKLINANIFSGLMRGNSPGNPPTTWETVLFVIIPAMFILILLMKAADFAKKGGGKFAEVTLGAIKAAAVIGIGGAALGGAALARGSIGAFMKGASTGDTAANRMVGSAGRIAAHQATIANPASTIIQRTQAKKEILREKKDQIKGVIQQKLGIQRAQNVVGGLLNEDQHNVEHAAHARHDLDEAAGKVAHGKKWDELNGEQRYQARRQVARDRVVRDNSGATPAAVGSASYVPGLATGFGSRKWDTLTTAERALIDAADAVGDNAGHARPGLALAQNRTVADNLINESRIKQGVISSVVQSTVNGSYDVRNLAKMIAREQTTGMAKFSTALLAGLAMSMRSGFKTMGINYGEGKGNYFKDLSETITEALKNVKINIEIPNVGEVKKESDHGHGGHH